MSSQRGGGYSRGGGGGGGSRGGGPRNRNFVGGGRAGSTLDEDFKLAVTRALTEFRASDDETITFPPTLTNVERQFVHGAVAALGLASKSHGKGDDRRLSVKRAGGGVGVLAAERSSTRSTAVTAPALQLERSVEDALVAAAADGAADLGDVAGGAFGARALIAQLSEAADGNGAPRGAPSHSRPAAAAAPFITTVPSEPNAEATADWTRRAAARDASPEWAATLAARRALPAWRTRDAVSEAMRTSQIVIVSGDTGCGKSTQVPQFILDDARDGARANIIVTQPRRVAAIALAERVAHERGEAVGDGVGYNVRLESATSSATRLLFCTTGVLLRRLTSGRAADAALAGITHVVVDEVHERDVHTDFVLVCLRDLLPRRPDLRVVVMSATLQIDLLRGYFEASLTEARATMQATLNSGRISPRDAAALKTALALAPKPVLVHVDGSAFPVTRLFLEDVLEATGFFGGGSAPINSDAADRLKRVVEDARAAPPPTKAAAKSAALVQARAATPYSATLPSAPATPKTVPPPSAVVSPAAGAAFNCTLCGKHNFESAEDFGVHAGECFGGGSADGAPSSFFSGDAIPPPVLSASPAAALPAGAFTCSLCARSDFANAEDFGVHAGECFGGGSADGAPASFFSGVSSPSVAEAASAPAPVAALPVKTAGAFTCSLCARSDFETAAEFGDHAGECFGGGSANGAPASFFSSDSDAHTEVAPAAVSTFSFSAAEPGAFDVTDFSATSTSSAHAPSASPPSSSSSLLLPGGARAKAAAVASGHIIAAPASETDAARAELLKRYQAGVSDPDTVDTDLLVTLVAHLLGGGSRETLTSSAARGGANVANAPGAILVFLHGWDEITKATEALRAHPTTGNSSRVLLLPLHSQVPSSEQRRVFKRPPPGVTKVILATNIAETSLTIDDVVFVIDAGRVREKTFDAYTGCSSLAPVPVSQASARQRAGRAGRVRAGVSFALYSRAAHDAMAPFSVPEMLRTPLDELALQVHLLVEGAGASSLSASAEGAADGASVVARFLSRAVQPPESHAVRAALFSLHAMGGLEWGADDDESSASAAVPTQRLRERLTPLGRALARLPVSPRLGKMLLFGALFQCLDPLLTIAAGMSGRPPWVLPMVPGERARADRARLSLAGGARSDHLALVGASIGFAAARRRGGGAPFNSAESAWCREAYVSAGAMNTLAATKTQLIEELRKAGVLAPGADVSSAYSRNAGNTSLVLACLAAGLYPSVARANAPSLQTGDGGGRASGRIDPTTGERPDSDEALGVAVPKMETRTKRKVGLHPSSVNARGNEALLAGAAQVQRRGDSGALSGQPKGMTEWIAYDDMATTGSFGAVTLRGTTVCSPLALLLLAGRCDGAPPRPAPPPPGMPPGVLIGGPSPFERALSSVRSGRAHSDSLLAAVDAADAAAAAAAAASAADSSDDDAPSPLPPAITPTLRVDDFIALTASSRPVGVALALLRARFALAFHRTVVFPGAAAAGVRAGLFSGDFVERDARVIESIARALTQEGRSGGAVSTQEPRVVPLTRPSHASIPPQKKGPTHVNPPGGRVPSSGGSGGGGSRQGAAKTPLPALPPPPRALAPAPRPAPRSNMPLLPASPPPTAGGAPLHESGGGGVLPPTPPVPGPARATMPVSTITWSAMGVPAPTELDLLMPPPPPPQRPATQTLTPSVAALFAAAKVRT